ncbi:hypothetical protein MLD38_018894 [Melastoma candidum]|uniref:Uncharacterized protein n=1 Tax=Melastoma candidum TaxID=119954 RepID=A0ACB9QYQ7_9MYRT|nr:hypothetical protein MLD38_018894 [Melastoma candidum]
MADGASSSSSRVRSVVSDCGRQRSSCGYCRSPTSSGISHGLWAQSLTVDDYQDLLDRGWRRSGCFLYKPEMRKTCCPSYTIRLKAEDFAPSKEQTRVIRRMERYLDGDLEPKGTENLMEGVQSTDVSCSCNCHEIECPANQESSSGKDGDLSTSERFVQYLSNEIDLAVIQLIEDGSISPSLRSTKSSVRAVSSAKRKKLVEGSEDLMYTSNIAFQVAAALKKLPAARKDEQLSISSNNTTDSQMATEISAITISQKLASLLSQVGEATSMSIQGCNGHLNFYSTSKRGLADESGHVIPLSKECSRKGANKRRCLVKCCGSNKEKRRKLEVILTRSSFDLEEFKLYQRYQIKVHNDNPNHITESSYRRFLVDTPLVYVPFTGDETVPPCGFGSFHQRYLVDGRLVAVGVVDVLPRCLSSKYLFWDPDVAFLSLGKYTALREISWVKENQSHCPALQFYYLGYYIHSCKKMRYKASYRPSELLCPQRYQWVFFDIVKTLLDRKKYVVLSDYAGTGDKPLPLPSCDDPIEHEHDEADNKDSNNAMTEDSVVVEPEVDDSDNELVAESSDEESSKISKEEAGDILIGLRDHCLRYRDLRRAFGPSDWGYLEEQLQSYVRVVGGKLSKRMVYSLG